MTISTTAATPKKRTSKVQGKRQLNIYITPESDLVLRAILERDGVPYGAQIDRALRLWAIEKGIEVPAHGKQQHKGPAR